MSGDLRIYFRTETANNPHELSKFTYSEHSQQNLILLVHDSKTDDTSRPNLHNFSFRRFIFFLCI